jgi:membrane protein DedA with SNARE-associated domain
MPDILHTLIQYIDYFPLVAIICLFLASLNVPMSEDLIIITGAILSRAAPDNLVPNLLAIFFGAVLSDYMVFGIVTQIRKGAIKCRFISGLLPQKRHDKMRYYFDKYGIFTFIVCRFIPFGVRNSLCIASALSGLRFRTFVLFDTTAAIISVNTLFFLVYFLGEQIEKPFKTVGIILFILLVGTISFLVIRIIVGARSAIARRKREHTEAAC